MLIVIVEGMRIPRGNGFRHLGWFSNQRVMIICHFLEYLSAFRYDDQSDFLINVEEL